MLINIILKKISMSKYMREVLSERCNRHVFLAWGLIRDVVCILGVSSAYSSSVLLSVQDPGPSLSDYSISLDGVIGYHSLKIPDIFLSETRISNLELSLAITFCCPFASQMSNRCLNPNVLQIHLFFSPTPLSILGSSNIV